MRQVCTMILPGKRGNRQRHMKRVVFVVLCLASQALLLPLNVQSQARLLPRGQHHLALSSQHANLEMLRFHHELLLLPCQNQYTAAYWTSNLEGIPLQLAGAEPPAVSTR